ncbi:unknown protein [Seminavis robusta]|uniref:VWFD domain-containing protein n=1 Tax=Seminavis robusta TaxID=568900 RepID=A0A9N8EBP7_9STRA|nr:unknown protein [Seminavis robusta]|eukprot:Sro771_g200140.1 n/a (312) ;mRNA; f:16152-17154
MAWTKLLVVATLLGSAFGFDKIDKHNEEDPDGAVVRHRRLSTIGGVVSYSYSAIPSTELTGQLATGPKSFFQIFGNGAGNNFYDDTPLYSNTFGSPTLSFKVTEKEFSLSLTQTQRLDPAVLLFPGFLKGEMTVNGKRFWAFTLKFTVQAPSLRLRVEGSIVHVNRLTPAAHDDDSEAGIALPIDSEIDIRFNLGLLGQKKEGNRKHEVRSHSNKVDAPGHRDCMVRNSLVGDCCAGTNFRDFSYNLRVLHSGVRPKGFGEPHFVTWTGQLYDYQGECDLVLLSAPNLEHGSLDIHIRTRIRYGKKCRRPA